MTRLATSCSKTLASRSSRALLAITVLLGFAGVSAAENESSAPTNRWQDWLQGDRALDGLVPLRRDLEDRGVFLGGSYTTDLLGNPVGGMSPGFTYFGQLQLFLVAEMEKLVGWRDGYFVMSMIQSSGTDLSQDYIGNYFDVAEISAIPTLVLGQLYFEQRWNDDKISLKLGRMGIGQDFVVMDMFNLYLGGIDGHTPVFGYNTFWTSNASRSTWAAVLKVEPASDWTLRYGIYQATPASSVIANHGLNMEFSSDNGLQMFGEVGRKITLSDPWRDTPEGLPGNHKFGGYWSSYDYDTYGGGSTPYSYGFYWIGQQMVWRERAASDAGITLWYSFVYAPQTDLAQFPFFTGAGGGWQGLLPSRPDDWVLFGSYYGVMSWSFASDQQAAGLGDPTYEWVLEWDYRAQVTPWLYVMPSVQYVIRPGGTGEIPNALVLGAEIGITF
jgi:porin